MKVRYALLENGAALASGEERITDLGYLMRINMATMPSDTLKYEKVMLSNWFRTRFAKFGASAG